MARIYLKVQNVTSLPQDKKIMYYTGIIVMMKLIIKVFTGVSRRPLRDARF